MKKLENTQVDIGIVGGGQLARMLIQAGQSLGFSMATLTDRRSDPAARVTPLVFVQSQKSLFLKSCRRVLIESEWAPLDVLSQARSVQPRLRALDTLSSKLSQKRLLVRLGIPTADYLDFKGQSFSELKTWLDEVSHLIHPTLMLKWDRFGYDGKGVLRWKRGASNPGLKVFFEQCKSRGSRLYAEEAIPFKREAALVAAQSTSGEWAHYPMVWTEQAHGICSKVWGPAVRFGMPQKHEDIAVRAAKRLAHELGLSGTFAMEWFWNPRSPTPLLVNEIAPRVHNSGHFTLDSAHTSQFENHIRGCMGLPLGSTETLPEFGMFNLIGKRLIKRASPPLRTLSKHAHLHWYDKLEERPGRKMGHIGFDSVRALDYFARSQ